MSRERIISGALVASIVLVLLAVSVIHDTPVIPTATAKFAFASWSFPDSNGEGIERFSIYENSTGGWEYVTTQVYDDDPLVQEWNASVGMFIFISTWLNSTLVGAATKAEGKNYQRHNVTVTNRAGDTVFSQGNFTYYNAYDNIDPPLWFYQYTVVLDFLPLAGEYYTVTMTYETFW